MPVIITAARAAGIAGCGMTEPRIEPRHHGWLARLLLGLVAAATCAGFVGLGLWQLGRGGSKAEMLDAFDRALAAPAARIEDALAQSVVGPRHVAGELRLAPEWPWLLLDNQRRGAAVGVRAYRVYRDPGSSTRVLVEFGWLALPPSTSRALPALPEAPARLDIDGLLLPPPSAGIRLAPNAPLVADDPAPRLLTYLDPAELATQIDAPLHPQVLRPDPGQPPTGFVRDTAALPNTLTPAQHYGYAVQWFGLALALAVIAGLLLFRKRP